MVPSGQTHGHLAETLSVPLAVRARTSDGADLRLLLEVTLAPELVTSQSEIERIAQALVVPALRRWLVEHALSALPDGLLSARTDLEAVVQPEFEALGARLLRLDVVAVEHLLTSPSAEPMAGDAE